VPRRLQTAYYKPRFFIYIVKTGSRSRLAPAKTEIIIVALTYALTWIVIGILTAVVAAAKGRDWSIWLALGVTCGIFALAYVAFAPRGELDKPVA
jgi:hypothetical protein